MKLIIFIILYLFTYHEPNNKILNDEKQIDKIATEVLNAENEFDIKPKGLIAYWAFHESRYNEKAKGKIGEIGVCQAHGTAKRICIKYGLDLTKRKDQFRCTGLLFKTFMSTGSIEKSLRVYASGSPHLSIDLVKGRLKRFKKIKSFFSDYLRNPTEFLNNVKKP